MRRVEAVRFGRLDGVTLGDLGDGLTVVLGPNEAGKSSFTTLVRHVLYGFPTPASKEAYISEAGKRLGRLVFADGEGEWVVERAEGPRGGPMSVRAISGSERPGLVDELTRGVSATAFHVVFGFGLAELADIERARSSGDDLISRLYAAGAGLSVSPQDARAAISKRADELWGGRASSREVNKLVSRMQEIRSRLQEVELQADQYADDRRRLTELTDLAEAARTERDTAQRRRSELVRDAEQLEQLECSIVGLREEIAEGERHQVRLRERLAGIDADEGAVARGPEVDSLLEEVSAVRRSLANLREQEANAGNCGLRLSEALHEAGASEQVAMSAELGPATIAELERHRATLSELQSRSAEARRLAEEDRIAAERAERMRAGETGRAAASPLARLGIASAALGVLLLIAGLVIDAAVAQLTGGALLVLGTLAILWLTGARSSAGSAVGVASGAAERAAASSDAAARAEAALERAREEWHAWIAGRGLDGAGDDPAAVAALVALLKDAKRLAAERDEKQGVIENERAYIDSFSQRLTETMGVLEPGTKSPPPEELPVTASKAGEIVKVARERAAEREALEVEIGALAERQEELGARLETSLAAEQDILGRHGPGADDRSAIQALAESVLSDLERAALAYDELVEERGRLEGRLGEEERRNEMAELRLELAGSEDLAADASARYAVLRVADRLLASAQERYERERQPGVVREAADVFSKITGGRYERLAIPLGDGHIEVFDAQAGSKSTLHLSGGTAEQLYLSLRIGLLRQLGDAGRWLPVLMDDIMVNFDPERAEGAAAAVAELATTKQVVVFTCHPQTSALFEKVAPGHTSLTLERC